MKASRIHPVIIRSIGIAGNRNLYRDSYRDFKLTGGSIGLEAYKPLKAKVSGDRAEVVVYGFESYSLKQK